jgi:c-di-GMP-binding flagellar brake protein YcgR
MSNPIPPKPSDVKSVSQKNSKKIMTNLRKSTRYMRFDLGITVRKIGFLKLSFLKNKDVTVKLVDISSRGIGILVATDLRLALNQKVCISVRFRNFKEFEIPSTVVRKSSVGDVEMYGIKFDRISNTFANYLLKTQTKLTFK